MDFRYHTEHDDGRRCQTGAKDLPRVDTAKAVHDEQRQRRQ